MIEIGSAIAGHAARIGDKNNPKYDNSLTDLVLLIIAEQSLRVDAERNEEIL